MFLYFDSSMNNQRLKRANSFIRAHKERAGIAFKFSMLKNSASEHLPFQD